MNNLLKSSKIKNEIISLGKYSQIKVIDADTVRAVVSMPQAIDLMQDAFMSLADEGSYVPQRSVVESPDKSLTLFFKPVFDRDLDVVAVKFLAQNEMNRKIGLPTINGIVLLLDKQTGKILSILDGNSITSLRTGALSGLATRLLSRPDSRILALFGCGAQGRTQIEAVLSVRDIEKVWLFDTDECTASNLMVEFNAKYGIPFEYTGDMSVLRSADIICTATGSCSPLFEPDQISAGTHINAIGSYKPVMQEIHPEVIRSSRLYVDQKSACISESGDIIIPLNESIITEDHIIGEMSELVSGRVMGRKSSSDITVFKTVGVAVQDLFVANAAYRNSSDADQPASF